MVIVTNKLNKISSNRQILPKIFPHTNEQY